jgi:hypothetical protein
VLQGGDQAAGGTSIHGVAVKGSVQMLIAAQARIWPVRGRSIGTRTMIRSGMWWATNWRQLGARYSLMAYSAAKTAQIR